MISVEEEDRLKSELLGLFSHLNRMRQELATLHHDDTASFDSMADTLDAIVESTETAGNLILENMEQIDSLVGNLCVAGDESSAEVCGQINQCVNRVFEACSFQDLTGQRITRVVRSLKFVEERIGAMIRMWGKEELEKFAFDLKGDEQPEPDADAALLHGPQRANVAISQEDIDKLFG